ncbi:MAG: transposase [Candidatus Sungbacteria bacterium]|nr:transposase [Candidatus Sungbacteria bacterium]
MNSLYNTQSSMKTSPRVRKDLNADALFSLVRSEFEKIPDKRHHAAVSLTDALMSGLALFSLKDPSLLAFEARRTDETIKNIYHIKRIPSDTNMRTTLDEVSPSFLERVFNKVLAKLQRGKGLEDMVFYDGHYLISNDGTGYFSSETIHCGQCLTKTNRSGDTVYAHQFLGSCIVHPDRRVVIPLCPEPIKNSDGSAKNDCERNAGKRLLARLRRNHPRLRAIIVEDALAANAPHLGELRTHDFRYIIGAKPDGNAFLFAAAAEAQGTEHTTHSGDGTEHRFRFVNDLPLNASHTDMRVNFIEYWETKSNGGEQHFTWITDLPVTMENVYILMRGARGRWKIENETFNTLKNQGYQFEHNFGHGNKNLSTVFALLMMLAFLIDQIQQKCCAVFQAAWEVSGSKRALWERIRGAVLSAIFPSMVAILLFIATRTKFSVNTS